MAANGIAAPVPRANFLIRSVDQLSGLLPRVYEATRHLFFDAIPRLIVNQPIVQHTCLAATIAMCWPFQSLVSYEIAGFVFGFINGLNRNPAF